VLLDLPFTLYLSGDDVWEPSNYDGEFEGQVSLRQALVRSRNVPTVRLASEIGIEDVAAAARAAGVVEPMDVTPSLALGTVAVSPLEIASAYTTFATLGYTSQPTFVLRVMDEEGTVLWEPELQAPAPGLDPRVAYILTDILRDAVDYGTGAGVRSAGYDGPVAGKTGTTNDATDAWFVGYTPKEVGAIWIGYDQPQTLGGSATGGGFAAPVWGRIMRRAYEDREMPEEWATPEGIVSRRVDTETGFVLQDGCHPRGGYESVEIFLEEFVPSSVCPYQNFWINMWDRLRGVVRLPVRANPLFDNPEKRPRP
jgi:penicillin-binding protein 1A